MAADRRVSDSAIGSTKKRCTKNEIDDVVLVGDAVTLGTPEVPVIPGPP